MPKPNLAPATPLIQSGFAATTAALVFVLSACTTPGGPPAAPKPAVGAPAAMACDALAARFAFAGTRLVSAERIAAGQLRLPGITEPMPEHCVVKGLMHERTGPVDGKPYAIGFEMRLPTTWNGRFFYQEIGRASCRERV